MQVRYAPGHSLHFSFALLLWTILLVILWLAGGASRADVPGQAVVRGASWLFIVAGLVLLRPKQARAPRSLWLILAAAAAIPVFQLLPLPPALWSELPGREQLAAAATLTREPQPWRPISISPSYTMNAALSLVVPIASLFLLTHIAAGERNRLPALALAAIVASALLGLLQVSGVNINNPFVNDSPGQVSGSFANRNHFALLLAIGCLLAPIWAFLGGRRPRWRGPVAVGSILLFLMMLLAVGSRAGILLGALAIGLALFITRNGIRRELRRAPVWARPVIAGSVALGLVAIVGLSVLADRALALSRIFEEDVSTTARVEALPTMMEMVRASLPIGFGMGTFDPAYRMREPLETLSFKYLNHAHNDLLEVVIDAGLFGAALLLVAALWWSVVSLRAWRTDASEGGDVAKAGSATLLLVLVASLFDYPARTPFIMMMIVLAAYWLSGAVRHARHSALPSDGQHL